MYIIYNLNDINLYISKGSAHVLMRDEWIGDEIGYYFTKSHDDSSSSYHFYLYIT